MHCVEGGSRGAPNRTNGDRLQGLDCSRGIGSGSSHCCGIVLCDIRYKALRMTCRGTKGSKSNMRYSCPKDYVFRCASLVQLNRNAWSCSERTYTDGQTKNKTTEMKKKGFNIMQGKI